MLRILLPLALAAMAVSCQESGEETDAHPPPPKESDPAAEGPADFENLVRERERLDETVYRDEREAQAHEQFLVRLWDRLRAEDPYRALGDQEFARLSLLAPGEPQARDWGVPGIRVTTFAEAGQILDQAGFRALLEEWKAAGWVLEQSEWHHDRFRPATPETPAQSRVAATGHLFNRQLGRRLILESKLEIVWATPSEEGGAASVPLPQTIKVAEMRAISRDGEPIFEPLAAIDVGAESAGRWRASQPVVLHDLDGDGLSELIVAGANLIYRNKGGGNFEKEVLSGLPAPLDGAVIVADFTGDGIPDLVGTARRGGLLQLVPGSAGGGFEASEMTTCFDARFDYAQGITAGDVDRDGDLDLFLFQYRAPYVGGQMPSPFHDANDGHPSFLLRNDGRGRFTDITVEAGLGKKRNRRTYSASLVDLDADGNLDLLVVSDFAGLDIYRGDGAGKFTDVTDSLPEQRHAFGMAQTLDDFNADGALDLYMIGMSSTTARRIVGLGIEHPGFPVENRMRSAMGYGNRLFFSRGGRFVPAEAADQVARTGWSWGVTSADFDNDGDRDIFVANGHVSGESCQDYCTRFWSHDIFTNQSQGDPAIERLFAGELQSMISRRTSWNGYEKNVLYLSGGGEKFLNAAYLLGVAHEFDSRAVASDDFDGDGLVDLLVVELDQRRRSEVVHLLRNRAAAQGHWLGVRLREARGGPSPLGARVTLVGKRGRRVAAIVAGDSFQAQHAPVAHFGLGPDPEVEAVEVGWPGGAFSRIPSPQLDRYHVIDAPAPGRGTAP